MFYLFTISFSVLQLLPLLKLHVTAFSLSENDDDDGVFNEPRVSADFAACFIQD